MTERHDRRLHRFFDRFERRLPRPAARWLAGLRAPGAMWIRLPLGLLLVVGGVLGFLPVLGFWMLPLGLLLLALDIPPLKRPVAGSMVMGQRRWRTWRRGRRGT
jgi:hypothetical protein